MEQISKFVENYTHVFEQCLLARDPLGHVRTLPDSIEKNLILFMLQPHTPQFKQLLKTKYQVKGQLLEDITKWKAYSRITNATKPEEVKYLIQKFIKDNPDAYNYAKPAQFRSVVQQGKAEEQSLSSTLKPIKTLSQWATGELDKNEDRIASFSRKALRSLSEERLLKLKTTSKEVFLFFPYLKDYSDKFVVEFVKTFYEEMVKKNQNYQIPTNILHNMSKSQFMLLRDAIPNLINKDEYLKIWFSHSYDQQLQPYQGSDLSMSEKDQKHKILVRILKDLQKLKTAKTKPMRRSVLKQLLLLDISREDVDKSVFLEYINDNPNTSLLENQIVRQKKSEAKSKKSKSSYYEQDIDLHITSSSTGYDEIIKSSLQRLFKRKDADTFLNELQEYFDVTQLNKIFARVRLTQGGKLEDYQNYLSINQVKALKEQKQITIIESNRRKWKAQEEVELKVRVKNINNIHVQIYKIDLEKHFTENESEIDQTQNLSYLQPNYSYNYTTDGSNPFLIQTYDMKIEGIPSGRGVWIVELEGEGISSRAFIRKGAVALTSGHTSAGTELKFFDETGISIKDYAIWMEGKKHIVDSTFTIPYGENDKSLNLVLVKDGYAQKFNIFVPKESYYLDVAYIYNTESFVVGSIAKLLLHPKLRLSFNRSMDVSFKLLEKVKILVTLTNNLGIKSTIDFDNVQFKSTQDYVLEFPVQSYTSRIEIVVSAKIKKYNRTEQELSSNRTIDINLSEDNTNFLDLYLKKTSEGYSVLLLGKSGEVVPNTEVIIQVAPEGRNSEQTQNLMTSENGSVSLGHLREIQRVTAKVNLKSGCMVRQWSLKSPENEVEIISNSIYQEGEAIVFPTPFRQKCQLWKATTNNSYSQNLSEKVICEEQKISIQGLGCGKYALELFESDARIEFAVVGGKLWENEHKIYDQKKGMLYEINRDQNNNFSLGEAKFTTQQNKTVVQIPVKSTYDIKQDSTFRAHLLVSNFVVPDFNERFTPGSCRGTRAAKYQAFNTKQSQFYNNKKLSEETSYVVNRGKEKKYIGNNLEKPKLFLKRIDVRDTSQAEEVLDQGGEYKQMARNEKRMEACYDKSSASYRAKAGGKLHGSYSASVPLLNPLELSTHNNFIVYPGSVVANEKGDLLRFQVPSSYSHFQCLAFTKSSAISKKFDNETQKIDLKNLRHAGIEKSSKDSAWTMSRQVYKAQKGENIKIGRDSVWSAVGISNVAGFAKIKGAILEDWVTNWNTYSEEQKKKTFDDKVCHELNTYIKYNDPQFFTRIVVPFLKNKLNKTFVDLCLLEQKGALRWAELEQFQLLNEFEKALLVHQLVKANEIQQAQSIANSMDNTNKSNRISFEQFKRQFDTVITAKLTEEAKKSILQTNQQRLKVMRKKRTIKMKQCQKSQRSRMDKKEKCEEKKKCDYDDDDEQSILEDRGRFSQPFKQMQKTKQYTETTYSKLKYAHESQNLVKASPFWTSLANHFIKGKGEFLSQNFMYLASSVEFTLAACFIPNQKLLNYGLTNQAQTVVIEPSSSFLVFVREVKSVPYEKKFGVLLNQRFFNPDDRYYYEEDGTRVEKETDQFVVRRSYCLQTLITNTSGTKLQLQLLIDIPEGTVPLKSHQNTQIQSISLEPYSTLSFERYFYFPSTGSFRLYPANACRGSTVIAKAEQIDYIHVTEVETVKKTDTLENILKSGEKGEILQYLKAKNIFDSKIFDPSSIFWMLKDRDFFTQVVDILRSRKYYLSDIWIFGYYHNDLTVIREFERIQNLQNQANVLADIPIFEYFPYYSSRAHKFLNENKSTIRNEQFKKTYFSFLFASLFNEPTSSRSRLAFIYYLLLQDRIDEAETVLSHIEQAVRGEHELQFDYIQCFIDMYKGYPTFSKARKVSVKYVEYPVKSWHKMFKEISDTLKQYDSEEVVNESKKIQYSASVLNEGSQLKISIPAETAVEVCLYDVNLQLYFSTFPFTDLQNFTSNIAPNSVQLYKAGQSRQQKLVRAPDMRDCFVEVYSSTSGLKRKKVSSFLWSNPNLKINVKEDNGYAQVFYQNKKQAGCYCKVYQMKNGQGKFYRDGYTDITGTFKYALADVEGISEFSILFVSNFGGAIQRVKPPSQQGYLA